MKIKLTLSSIAIISFVAILVFVAAVVALIDSRVTNKLEGVLWTVPAKVYSRTLDLAEGSRINRDNLLKELDMLSYSEKKEPSRPGQRTYDTTISSKLRVGVTTFKLNVLIRLLIFYPSQ